ncbi:MAG: response regulator [Campylobacterota bacterium]
MKKISSYLFYLLLLTISLSADINIIDLSNIDTQSDDFTLWTALFGLGIISLFALFLSSEQLENFKKIIYKKEEKRNNIEQKQNQILSDLSENIQTVAQETTDTAIKIVTDNEKGSIEKDLERVVNSEHQLLALTTNLIEFLKIKSKKVELVNEALKLSNLLNDITGTLKANTKDIEFELMYDVKSNIPEYIIGDTLNLSKVLNNILLYFVHNSAKEIKITISKDFAFSKKENLYFTVQSDAKIDVEHEEGMFNSKYNENTDSYDTLELFVASELSNLMNGELVAQNKDTNHIEFVLKIPFKEEKSLKSDTTLINGKKVLIVNSLNDSSSVIKDIFSTLKHRPKTLTKEEFLSKIPNFSRYDIVLIDEKLFVNNIVDALRDTSAKIICLSNLFKAEGDFQNAEIVDFQLTKPLTRFEVEKAIEQLYSEEEKHVKTDTRSAIKSAVQSVVKSAESAVKTAVKKDTNIITDTDTDTDTDTKSNTKELLVYKKIFEDSENIDLNKFADFNGINILLVEDNTINQKVFAGVLNRADITITNANNGQEAITILNSSQKFDIVFMDINMPVMDGYSAAAAIRAKRKFDNLPIIAISALTSASEVNKMFECGMNGYLSKPLRKEKLYTAFKLFITSEIDSTTSISESNKTSIDTNVANSVLQKEILLEFKNIYGNSAKKFKMLIEEGNFTELKVLSLDIRNLSSSIGAKDLHKLMAEILQQLSLNKYNRIYTYIDKYTNELDRLNKAIDKYLNK